MAEAKQTTKTTDQPDGNSWLSTNLLWGGLFMLVGLLLLLSNLGVVSIAWGEIWKLWPVVIIIIGLSILSIRGWMAGVVYGVAAVLIVGLTWLALTGNLQSSDNGVVSDEFSISRASDDVERLDVHIDTGASSLDISSHQGEEAVHGQIDSRLSDLKHQSEVDGDTQRVTLSQERNWQWLSPSSFNNLDVRLSQQLPTRLDIDAGASSIDADLSAVRLESLQVDSGASSISVKLGDKLDHADVLIKTGVSSVELRVPDSVGVKLTLDAGLSSRELPSDFEKVNDQVYKSADYDKATKKITIHVDMGVSSFKLFTY